MIVRETLLGKKTARLPLWFMRQAGRYLPEYQAIRHNFSDFMAFCYSPKEATEVTLQPITRFDLDAAIIFSDILVIPDALGQRVSFKKNHGPVLEKYKIKNYVDVDDDSFSIDLAPVYEAISQTRAKLSKDKALFGFAGTPWTLACYMIEEGKSEHFSKIINHCSDKDFDVLLDLLTHKVTLHLKNQIKAGADVVQLFDSWAIKAPAEDRERLLINPFIKIAKAIHQDFPSTPIVYYSRGEASLSVAIARAVEEHLPDVPIALGLWQGVDFADITPHTTLPLQGNLDPELLLQGDEAMEIAAKKICSHMAERPFVFNLGHGIIKETPPENLTRLIRCVRGG